jgi:hypothetical protein
MELAKLLDCVLIPVKGSLEDPSAKINVLPQAFFFLSITLYNSDMVYIKVQTGRPFS